MAKAFLWVCLFTTRLYAGGSTSTELHQGFYEAVPFCEKAIINIGQRATVGAKTSLQIRDRYGEIRSTNGFLLGLFSSAYPVREQLGFVYWDEGQKKLLSAWGVKPYSEIETINGKDLNLSAMNISVRGQNNLWKGDEKTCLAHAVRMSLLQARNANLSPAAARALEKTLESDDFLKTIEHAIYSFVRPLDSETPIKIMNPSFSENVIKIFSDYGIKAVTTEGDHYSQLASHLDRGGTGILNYHSRSGAMHAVWTFGHIAIPKAKKEFFLCFDSASEGLGTRVVAVDREELVASHFASYLLSPQ